MEDLAKGDTILGNIYIYDTKKKTAINNLCS